MAETLQASGPAAAGSPTDETLLIFARLMEGGRDDKETCRDLNQLTKALTDDADAQQSDKQHKSICSVIDSDCVDTILGYLDMRQDEVVRGHATLTTSAYLKAAEQEGSQKLSAFFFERVRRGTYDDYIVAFCVAAAIFPVVPDLTSELFLSEGFLSSLGPLMRRKWKSRKVETACLEMLSSACRTDPCRKAIQKYCTEWLEEIVDQDPTAEVRSMDPSPSLQSEGGSISMRRHSEQVKYLAAVILAKLRVSLPFAATANKADGGGGPVVENAASSLEELAALFIKTILREEDDHGRQYAVEGLAYSSLRPQVKESIAGNPALLKKIFGMLKDSTPRSPMTFGILTMLSNLTAYLPPLSEEEKKMRQLKAYADAAGKMPPPDPLNDDAHVEKRCKAVFDTGVTPVLVAHTKGSSIMAISTILQIIDSFSKTRTLRGPLAGNGAVTGLLDVWSTLPEAGRAAQRAAAQTLARILISTDPNLVFRGNRAPPVSTALRALVSIIPPDTASDRLTLLPTFEALMALTNLASLDDLDVATAIVRLAWHPVEEQLISSNAMVSRAAIQLVCNLARAPEGIALFADGNSQAKERVHILLALADSEDAATRSAAGGALGFLTQFPAVTGLVVKRERGVKVVLGMCVDEDGSVRERGVVTLLNMVSGEGEEAKLAREQVQKENGEEILRECVNKSKDGRIIEVVMQILKILLGMS